jgi:hypothetical protein
MDLVQGWDPVQPEERRTWQKGPEALQAYRAEIWQASCSFIISWCGEAFHDLKV